MKKMLSLILAICLVLTLAACGGAAKEKKIDVQAVYDSYQQYLPEMFFPDEETLLNFLGISVEDCVQCKVAICAEGLQADEIWLIEAKDDDVMKELKELAEIRIDVKLDETESYVPDQYPIVQKGQVLTHGRFLALLVSPDVDALKEGFEAAFQ